jgi:pimeloyl-ACP methyl ester carboxylesterase
MRAETVGGSIGVCVGRALVAVLTLLFASISTSSEAGRLVTHDFSSDALAGNRMGISNVRRITVLVPDAYDRQHTRYPVVYYIPGFPGSGTRLLQRGLGAAIDNAGLPPVLTVLIDLDEGIVVLNSQEFGGWSDFFIDELIPFIDRTYRTIRSPGGRAVIGASMGGLSAVILSARHPGVWGSIGLNDGAAYYAGYYELHVGRERELPAGLQGDFQKVLSAWKSMPSSLEAYSSLQGEARFLVQLGLAISPNPATALRFDPPIDRDGNPVPAVLEKWRAYCFLDPMTIAKNKSVLSHLAAIALVVPDFNDETDNAYQNAYWLDLMAAAGIAVTRIDMPGGHTDFPAERFVALERAILQKSRR